MRASEAENKLTYDDFVLFPDDGMRHELIDGEHCVTAAPNVRHQRVLGAFYRRLDAFVREHGLGEVFFAPLDVVMSRHDVVEPDLLFVSTARSGIFTPANLQGVPDLLVEILSPSSRRQDEVKKRDLYERAGVDEYWVVDPDADTVKVFRRQDGGGYGRPQLLALREGDVLTSPLLPGLRLALSELFAQPQ